MILPKQTNWRTAKGRKATFHEGNCPSRPVAEWGAGGGAVPPQQEIKLKLCPTKPKFAHADFNNFFRSYK